MGLPSSLRNLQAFQPIMNQDFDMIATEMNPIVSSPACVSPVASSSAIERTVSPDIEPQGNGAARQTKAAPKKGKKTAKRTPTSRRKWKKPADKPKRPLSAYNLYFKDQREKIIRGEVSNWSQARGFRAMAQFIAKKWNVLDGKARSLYEARAMEEKRSYFVKLAQWKRVKKQRELLEEMSLLQSRSKLGLPMMSYANMLQESCHPPTEDAYNKAYSSYASYGPSPSQESMEPLPVDFPMNSTNNVDTSLPRVESSNFDKSYESVLDSLDDVFEYTPRTQSRRNSLVGFNATQRFSDETSENTSSVMQRVLATFDVLDVDDDFADFMSSMEWK